MSVLIQLSGAELYVVELSVSSDDEWLFPGCRERLPGPEQGREGPKQHDEECLSKKLSHYYLILILQISRWYFISDEKSIFTHVSQSQYNVLNRFVRIGEEVDDPVDVGLFPGPCVGVVPVQRVEEKPHRLHKEPL